MRQKVDEENECRVCGAPGAVTALQAAHVIARSQVSPGPAEDARNCVPLCPSCHRLYDVADSRTGRTLDLVPYLSKDEQAYAVELVGIEHAYARLVGGRRTPDGGEGNLRGKPGRDHPFD